jgi:hypothetical protein
MTTIADFTSRIDIPLRSNRKQSAAAHQPSSAKHYGHRAALDAN